MDQIKEGQLPTDEHQDIENYEDDEDQQIQLPTGMPQNHVTLNETDVATFVDTSQMFPGANYKTISPRRRPRWINNAHISHSKDNHAYHTQYRQYFDKKFGERQYTDQFKCVYKTPSNGQKEYYAFDNDTKYYWEKRSPVDPKSKKKYLQDFIEDGFIHDFNVMYSKNNNDRHPLRREYFDKPVNYIHRGFLFSPRHKLPLELYDNGKSHFNVREHGKKSTYKRTGSHSSPKSMKSNTLVPRINSIRGLAADITTGMPSQMLYQDYLELHPKPLAKKAAQISNDYGTIPGLREPISFTKNKRFKGFPRRN